MHELTVVFDIIDQIVEVAKENNAKEITGLTLEIGEVSMVVNSFLEDCFDWAKKRNEYTKNCKLKIEMIEAVTYCEDCKGTYETVKYGKICPHCASEHTYLLKGNEVIIKELEVN